MERLFSQTKVARSWRQPSPNGSHLPNVSIRNSLDRVGGQLETAEAEWGRQLEAAKPDWQLPGKRIDKKTRFNLGRPVYLVVYDAGQVFHEHVRLLGFLRCP